MKKYILFLLLVGSFCLAQTNRFIYAYKFVPDINEKDTVRKEMMLLDINEKGSLYYSHAKFVQDSLIKADFDRQISTGTNNVNINRSGRLVSVRYKVTKSYPDFEVFLIDQIGEDRYKILEDEKLHWKIHAETQKIGEYNAQKATASFGGREWTAWFSKDIPFQDGPYKFHGLPGLIVKAEDSTGSHVMTLVANRKVAAEAQSTELVAPGMGSIFDSKQINVDEKKFRKLWNDYLNDPAKGTREMMMKNSGPNQKVMIKVMTQDGKEITDINEIYRTIEKRVQDYESKNNNKIEPSLYSRQ